MDHDDYVRPQPQSRLVAALLVAAVAKVFRMDDGMDSELPCKFRSSVPARIIDEHNVIHDLERDLLISLLEGLFSIVGRHDHHYFFAVKHVRLLIYFILGHDNYKSSKDF